MTRSRDMDRILDRWMDDGPTGVSDHVIAGAMTEIQTTRQRGARRARLKEIIMTRNPAAMVAGIAAVIILGFAAYGLVPDGGPGTGASPGPTAAPDLGAILAMDDNATDRWAVEATLQGHEVLARLVRYSDVGNATPGFIDARATDICAIAGCGTSWVALYESEADAEAAFMLIHAEMQIGWGLGDDAQSLGLGEDEGHSYMNNLGNAPANHAYLWRKGNLLLGVIGLAELDGIAELDRAALRSIAEDMNARSR